MRASAELVAVFFIRGRSVVVRTNVAKWLKFMIDIERERTPKMVYFVIMDTDIPFASLSKGRANLQV
jgi:hypothetical protein